MYTLNLDAHIALLCVTGLVDYMIKKIITKKYFSKENKKCPVAASILYN